MNHDSFPFTISEPPFSPSAQEPEALIASVLRDISTKAELLERLAEKLRFPAYFGDNWDSLEECLRDLSWIENPLIIIAHESLPHIPLHEQKIYVEILESAFNFWRKRNPSRLQILFPASGKSAILSLLANENE